MFFTSLLTYQYVHQPTNVSKQSIKVGTFAFTNAIGPSSL